MINRRRHRVPDPKDVPASDPGALRGRHIDRAHPNRVPINCDRDKAATVADYNRKPAGVSDTDWPIAHPVAAAG